MREGRAGKHGDGCVRLDLMGDLADKQAGACLHSLGAEHQRRAAARCFSKDRADELRRHNDQQGIARGKRAQRARRFNRAGQLNTGKEKRILMSGIDRVDDVGLARPEQHWRAVPRRDARPVRCPRAPTPMTLVFMPSPPRHAPPRPPDRVASAGVPAHRAGLSGRRRSARRRPSRSSRHCRCTAIRAARRTAGEFASASVWSAARTERLAATPPATTSAVAPSARASARAVRSIRQSTTAAWNEAAISSADQLPVSRARATALFRPAKEKCGSSDPFSGRGRGTARESPSSAARSTAGPPGKPRPSSLAVLSDASPAASSIVVARRAIGAGALRASSNLTMPARGKQQQVGKGEIGIGKTRRKRMALKMIDRDQRLACGMGERLAGHQPHHDTANQPGPGWWRRRHRPQPASPRHRPTRLRPAGSAPRRARVQRFREPHRHKAGARPPARAAGARARAGRSSPARPRFRRNLIRGRGSNPSWPNP